MMTYEETKEVILELNRGISMPDNWKWRIDLSGANLIGADLNEANMRGADLSGANMRGANLSGADLSGADLSGANMRGADLIGANLSGANLIGANLSGAVGIITIHFEGFTMYIRANKTRIGCKEMMNEEWLKLDVEKAIEMGIKREHFEVYRAFFDAAMLILKPAGIEGEAIPH
jgi:uncharacterized protein YjbI with pentapeptide repeats